MENEDLTKRNKSLEAMSDKFIQDGYEVEKSLVLTGISISGFGVYIGLESIKFCIEICLEKTLLLPKLSVLLFFICIVLILLRNIIYKNFLYGLGNAIQDVVLKRKNSIDEPKFKGVVKRLNFFEYLVVIIFIAGATLLTVFIFGF